MNKTGTGLFTCKKGDKLLTGSQGQDQQEIYYFVWKFYFYDQFRRVRY